MEQLTIIGTGLIGGSLGLALKRYGFRGRIVGCDRPEVLARAQALGAIDASESDPVRSAAGSQIVVLATPVSAIIDLIERLGPVLPPSTLLTDAGSTKAEIAAHAQRVFGAESLRRFLPGHPMAGKEIGGIDAADADLFVGANWVLTPPGGLHAMIAPEFSRGPHAEWMRIIESIGSNVVLLDAERHDRICAYTSHMPQMLSTALAATLVDELGDESAITALAGRGVRDMVRLSESSYGVWRDIALTNTKNLQDALLRLEQKLAHMRENLRTRELNLEFDRAHELDLDTPAEERTIEDDTEPPRF